MSILLQINVAVNFGSTGRIAEHIGKLAMQSGWQSYIGYGRIKKQSDSKLIPIGGKWGHLNHLIKTRLFDRHGLESKRATKKFIRQIKKIKPSIIHLHNIHGYYINLELLFDYLATSGIPIVWTLHDCWTMTGHCTHFEHVGCEKWQTKCYNCPQLRVYPSSWGVDRSEKNYELKKNVFNTVQNLTIVSVSNWLNTVVQKSFLSKHSNRTIPNGIDITVFKPRTVDSIVARYSLNNKFVVLGVASVWSVNKGLKDFLDLNNLLSENETIVLIGLNKKQIADLPKNIIGIERTSSIDELAEWYSIADIYVNTSVEESFGMTTAEALACGTPVIVYNTTANPEMVVPEVGYINEKNNIKELFKNITEIKRKGKRSFAKACRDRAINLYDKNKNFTDYIKLYERLVNQD